MAGEANLIFGKLAIKKGYLDETQLVEAIRVQNDLKEVGIEKSLGEILSERGIMSPDKVEAILDAQKYTQLKGEDRLYGEIAVRNGFCTVADVRAALAAQQAAIARKAAVIPPLGYILRECGKISDQQHEAIKKAQARLGKPLDLLEGSIASTGVQARKPAPLGGAQKCSVCGETPLRRGADRCGICGTPLPGKGKAADVAAAEMMRSSAEDERNMFGSVAVDLGFLTDAQVEECLAVQRGLAAKGIAKKLGDIMVAKSYLSPMQIERIVSEQLTTQGELVLDMGHEKKRTQFIPALNQNTSAVPARPAAKGQMAPRPARVAQQPAPSRGAAESFRQKNALMSFAMIGGGLLLLIAMGYGLFMLVSGRSSSDKDKAGTKGDPIEEAKKAERALREVEQLELAGAGAADISALISKYSQVADGYPDTPAGMKASARRGELTSSLEIAQEEFRQAQNAASTACSGNDYDKALRILDAFIARVTTMPGKPLLQDGKTYLDGLVTQAKADFRGRLAAVQQALADGKADVAVKNMDAIRAHRLPAYCEECRSSFEKLDVEVKTAKEKLDQEREAAAQTARRREEGRKQAPTLVADSRRLVTEAKFAEAILGFRKAMLFSGGGQVGKEAADGLAEAQAALKKTQSGLLTALNSVRNWTVGKQYAKAAGKCAEIVGNPSFRAFHEDFQNIAKELGELEKSKGDHAPMVKKYDEVQKAINDWVSRAAVPDPSLQCATCHGAGTRQCDACKGAGIVQGPTCKTCTGAGKVTCKTCLGLGTKPCQTCAATGFIERWEEQEVKCKVCDGKGKIKFDRGCPQCRGKGTVKEKVKTAPIACPACKGEKRIICTDCEKGSQKCAECKGRGVMESNCAKCEGKTTIPCPDCSGSGLNPEKF